MKHYFSITMGLKICLLCGVFLSAGCREETPPTPDPIKPIKIFTVGESLTGEGLEVYGRAQASQTADLSFRISGRLTELPVKQGDRVTAGQLVATLDQRDLKNREQEVLSQLDQAQATLQQMKTGARPEDISRLESILAAQQSEYQKASVDFDRAENLLREGVIPRRQFDQAKAALDVAEANLKNASQDLIIGQKGAREEEIAAQEAAIRGLETRLKEVRDGLTDTQLTAPYAGIISRVWVDNFEDVQAKQKIVTLQDTSKIDVVINISEDLMARGSAHAIKTGEVDQVVADVRFPAVSDQLYPVRLKEFQGEADPQTQTFEVTLQMDQPEGSVIKPGMNAVVVARTSNLSGADGDNMVPVSSVFSDESGAANVWIINAQSMTVARQTVQTGQIRGEYIEVLDGLSQGDQIAASAVNLLREGMQVEPMKDLGDL